MKVNAVMNSIAKSSEKEKKQYQQLVKTIAPKSPILRNCISAFFIGGLICDIGQFFMNLFLKWGFAQDEASSYVSITMVFLGALFTGLGLYDNLGKFAGAGSIVPITGFANSIVSPAIEFKHEGYVLGVGAKMFVIAGPVLVYGITASVIVGIIYYLIGIF